jgi:late competence protein required for DNA uptake (superfamily II DNA/RNA helicase)
MELRPYQEEAADFIYERDRSMILAPVGAGKTAITLTAMQDYIKNGIQLIIVSKTSPDQRKYRINCNDTFRNLLHWEGEGGIATKKPKFYVWDRCVNFIETFPSLITDEKDVEDIADNQNDHDYDAAKHIVMSLVPPPKLKDDEPVARKYITDKKKPKTVRFA